MSPNDVITTSKERALSDVYVQVKGYGSVLKGTRTKALAFIVVFALLGTLLFAGLGSPPIYIIDEARNAQCAREMMQNHTFIVPTFNGKLRTDKSPLHYFFMIGAYKLFGVSSFSARFFSAIFGLLTLLLVSLFTSKYLGSRVALLTTIILGSSTHFLFEFRMAVPDPYYIFFTLSAFLSGFAYLKEDKTGWAYAAALFAAFGTLAKGPVAVFLPVAALIIYAAHKKKWHKLFSRHMLGAFSLFLAVALPWYILVHYATNGEWTKSFFLDHNLERYSFSREGHGGFILLPLLVCLVGLLPFSSFLLEPIRRRKILFSNEAVSFSLIAFLVVMIVFSLSATKLPNYAIPAYPFAAIIIASYLNKVLNSKIGLPAYPLLVSAGIFCIMPIAVYLLLKNEDQTKELTHFAWLLAVPALMFVFFVVVMKRFSAVMRLYGTAGIYLLFNFLVFLIVYPKAFRNTPVSKTLPIVKNAPTVVAYRHANAGYYFYLDKPIVGLDADQIDSLSKAVPGTVVITSAALLKELDKLPLKTVAIEHDNFERRETVLLSR
ncbi:MAG: ArnT family glycosyltransferase [Flavisolibacter sp.]